MSRSLLEVTLHLPSGATLKGRGRNLPATIERVYNEVDPSKPTRHVVMTEHLKTGHVKKGEHRYEGTYHVNLSTAQRYPSTQEAVVVDVKEQP